MEEVIKWVVVGLLATVIAAVLACVLALPTMLLWNAVIPGIFGLKTISFLEALGLNALCSILFKSSSSSNSK